MYIIQSKGDRFNIGDNTIFTGVTLLGHDASPYVFIGVEVIILPGVKVGGNVVVAAGSIVTKNLDSNSVYAGNPARKVKDIHSYIEKYKSILSEFPEKF